MSGLLSIYDIEQRLSDVGALLHERNETAALVIVGGAALLLGGDADRLTTQDVDVVARVEAGELVYPVPLPNAVADAARVVAENYGLADDWLNAVVARGWSHQWPRGLPEGIREDVTWRVFGGLQVGIAGRSVLIPLKVHAIVDQSRAVEFDADGRVLAVDLSPPEARRHLRDLIALGPTDVELATARGWVEGQDGSPQLDVFLDTIDAYVRDHRH